MSLYRLRVATAGLLLLTACQVRLSEPRELPASAATVAFAAPGIARVEPKVTEIDELSFGARYQLIQWQGGSAMAIARAGVVLSSGGGYAESFGADEVAGLFKEMEIEHGPYVRVQVDEPYWVEPFVLVGKGIACVGIKRLDGELQDGHQLAGGRYRRQAVAAYCLNRTAPFTATEARAIADTMTLR